MTKIQYDIPDHIHHQAKVAAAQEGVTLKEFIIQAIAYKAAYPTIVIRKKGQK